MSETSRWIKPEDVPAHLADGWRLKRPVERKDDERAEHPVEANKVIE